MAITPCPRLRSQQDPYKIRIRPVSGDTCHLISRHRVTVYENEVHNFPFSSHSSALKCTGMVSLVVAKEDAQPRSCLFEVFLLIVVWEDSRKGRMQRPDALSQLQRHFIASPAMEKARGIVILTLYRGTILHPIIALLSFEAIYSIVTCCLLLGPLAYPTPLQLDSPLDSPSILASHPSIDNVTALIPDECYDPSSGDSLPDSEIVKSLHYR